MIDFLTSNWGQISTAITSIIGVASIIVKLTPTLSDDAIILPTIKFIAKFIALNVEKPNPEDRPKE